MTLNELRGKWAARADEFERLGAIVPASTLCRILLQELENLAIDRGEEVLSISEASQYSGYSQAHLARMVRQNKVRTLRPPGARGRFLFRQGDLPRKPSRRHPIDAGVHELASRLSKARGKEAKHGRL